MKIELPFDLLPHLDDTSIARWFRLQNTRPGNRTVIDLPRLEIADLVDLLRALENELADRERTLRQLGPRAPVTATRLQGLELRRQAVARAVSMLTPYLQASSSRDPVPQ